MSFANWCPAIKAGYKILGTDVDDAANIEKSQLKGETKRISVPLTQGTGTDSNEGMFPTWSLDESTQKYARGSIWLPTDYVSGNIKVYIAFVTAATSGDVKITVNLKSTPEGGTTAVENSQSVTVTVPATGGNIEFTDVTFASTLFAAGDIIGIEVTRDGSDAADTCASDIEIVKMVGFEYTGRC